MIGFQRGLDPAKKMDIGQHAIAPEIEDFFILDPEVMSKDPVTGKPLPSFQRILGESIWKSILQREQLRRNPRFIGVSFKKEVNGLPAGAIHRLSRLSGTFAKYDNESERLPKWNSKGEVI
jgi:hypothetical protein